MLGVPTLVVRDLGGIVTIAGVVGILIAVAGIYESVRAFRCGVIALIACGVFHVLAGLVLLSMNDRSGLGELIVAVLAVLRAGVMRACASCISSSLTRPERSG